MPARRKHDSALNPKEMLVAATLQEAARPLSAYDIIDRLKGQGFSSPPTVYRALARLVEAGLAHRLESLNAFVSCAHGSHGGAAMFAICDSCGEVDEFDQGDVVKRLKKWAKGARFAVRTMTLELRGRCAECAQTQGSAT